MDLVAVRGYIEAINEEYQSGNKQEKTKLLDVSERVLKLHRKHLIRRLNFKQFENIENYSIETRGRPKTYDYEALKPHISYLWNQMERVCSKRMKEALKEWLPLYKDCPANLKMQLLKMSSSTLERYLREIRRDLKIRKGLSTTNPARFMKNKIPLNTLDF